jgi:hypothetical protein
LAGFKVVRAEIAEDRASAETTKTTEEEVATDIKVA